MHLRLRLGPVRRPWLARTAGEFIDALTIAGMAAGLKERLADREERLEHGSGVLASSRQIRPPKDSSQVLMQS